MDVFGKVNCCPTYQGWHLKLLPSPLATVPNVIPDTLGQQSWQFHKHPWNSCILFLAYLSKKYLLSNSLKHTCHNVPDARDCPGNRMFVPEMSRASIWSRKKNQDILQNVHRSKFSYIKSRTFHLSIVKHILTWYT
jgi:hypothetical protein